MPVEKSAPQADRPFVISREFNARRDIVRKSWTEAERLKQWWGPKGFIVHTCRVDLRPGGVFHYGMTAPDGSEMWGRFLYREIEAPRRMVSINSFSDPEGGISRHPGHLEWPLQFLSTVTFEEAGGKTTVTVRWEAHDATALERKTFEEGKQSMQQGWIGTFEQFSDYLARAVRDRTQITATAGRHWKAENRMQKITPFLWFDSQAEEAMNLYTSIFKNSKTGRISRYGDAGPGPKGSVMSAEFVLDGQEFIALNGGPHFSFSPAVSFFVKCETQEEVDEFWEKLSAGGEKQRCGWLKDKFGVSWQIVPSILGKLLQDKDAGKSKRVMNAMMQMDKLDIKRLEQAALK